MDNTLFHIFFTITAAAVIVVTVLLAVLLIYIINIVRTVRRAVKTAEFAAELVKENVVELRDSIKRRGLTAGVITGFLNSFRRRRTADKRK